jgi:two-component system, OmpR family, KDP operon response regulator KdpE
MTQALHSVLIVDDEPQLRHLLRTALDKSFRVIEADTAGRALIEAATHKPDVVVLDLGLPDAEGHDVVRGIREWSALPIVVLSARTEEEQKIRALDAGADDYVTKPFSVPELLARLRVALRRSAQVPGQEFEPLHLGDVMIDLARRAATRASAPLHFTPIEYRLLAALAKQGGMVVTQRQLLREVWGPDHVDQPHYLRVYMKQLRQKIEPDPTQPQFLLTEIGVGYRLRTDG